MHKMYMTLILSAILVFAGGSVSQSDSGPKIVIEESVYDFKEAVEGQIVEHVFNVRNSGGQPLEIKKVSPG